MDPTIATAPEHDLESEQELLDRTQAYLAYRFRRDDPPPPLTAAWERFYYRYAQRVRAELARWNMTVAEREDCFQEVWASVIVRLDRFQHDHGRARLSTWLTTVARNKALDVLRRRRRHPVDGLFGGAEDELLDTSPDPITNYTRQEMRDQVRRVLAELSARVSARSYQVFYQRRMEGRTVPEIAVELGLTPNQVRLRDHRAMKRFRALLERSTCRENHRR